MYGNPHGHNLGCPLRFFFSLVRLLPLRVRLGAAILDVFPCLLEEGEFIESATIWESSRICAAAAEGQPQRRRNGVNFVLSELIAGIGEVAVIAGLTQIVSVFDARIYRVLKAVGCNPQLIGRPRRIGGTMSYAGLFDTGEGLLSALTAFREELGIEQPESKELARELAFA